MYRHANGLLVVGMCGRLVVVCGRHASLDARSMRSLPSVACIVDRVKSKPSVPNGARTQQLLSTGKEGSKKSPVVLEVKESRACRGVVVHSTWYSLGNGPSGRRVGVTEKGKGRMGGDAPALVVSNVHVMLYIAI